MNLRQETTCTNFRKKLKEELGEECYNCGSKEGIEYHHVVPISVGGTNNIKNFVPLCSKCHIAAHTGRNIKELKTRNSGGRPPKTNDEESYKIFDMYISGNIGCKKCKELLGYSERTQIKDRPQYKRYLKEKKIKEVKNNVDIVAVNKRKSLHDGMEVGYIHYENGVVEKMFYNDIGKNDVSYKKRGPAYRKPVYYSKLGK